MVEPGATLKEPPMRRIALLNVLVKDQAEAVAFYRDNPGFVVADDKPFGDKRWLTVRAPKDDMLSISLNLAESAGDKALVGKQGGSQPLLALDTDDCQADFRRMKSAGVKFRGEPVAQPWGTGVLLEDLYGNVIYLNQEP